MYLYVGNGLTIFFCCRTFLLVFSVCVVNVCIYLSINTSLPPQVLQFSDLPAGLVNIVTGSRDQLTMALATHSVIKAIWYWGSSEVRTTDQHIQHH